jgi:protein-disulfide isomerase/type II secretory pathway component PulC
MGAKAVATRRPRGDHPAVTLPLAFPFTASRPRLWPFYAALMLLAACGRPADAPQQNASGTEAHDDANTVVARIGGRAITASQADAPLQLALHDLEMQKYRLRRKVLETEVLRAFEAARDGEPVAELMLVPPVPPRVTVEADPARIRPAQDTPVTVLAFCNFESPHCARLQVTLSQVLPLFPGVVRYAERDLPMAFHRHAGQAAEAARCAADQGNYWRFHDLLYATTAAPDRIALDRAARSANLELKVFAECLDRGRHAAQVAADVAMAKSLGLSVVPAVFVNGLYASPDVHPADLVWLIERELTSLGVSSPRLVPADVLSTQPLQLKGVLASAHAGQGLALLAPSIAPERGGAYREGDAISTGVVLRRITSSGIELMRDGHAERLSLDTTSRPPLQSVAAPPADEVTATPHRAVPVTLDRDQVQVLLSDRIALAEALQPVPMTSGGYHQLRVQTVAPGSLYELLGLESGDVILSVNEQPVHEASNPLWDALEKEGEVRIRVIRSGGLAKHFTYRFSD